ncbi:MAG: phospho-N-acetylmuramoyl-pentapeptide-transferase [Candidatus Omnitrophica bacterium]|nr:phospho-N-acetylmuramoyl-pentapeptide-transferase [Candidatus Omnitrophota bacterium]
MFYFLTELRDAYSYLNIFRYITFRSGMAAVTTFLLCMILGPLFIEASRRKKMQEKAKREDAPSLDKFQESKEGTPTMGGLFIMGSIVVSLLLWANLSNVYVLLTLFSGVTLAILGGLDDYIKLTRKRRGLSARTKFIWQIVLAGVVGSVIYLNPLVSTDLDIPFFKNIMIALGPFYVVWIIFVVVGASNAVNLTDGLDGLAIGCTLMVALTLGVLSYVTGHAQFSNYLLIPYISGAGELTVVCAAVIGASLGFLWFNCYPASVFMGDVGSLPLGGILGTIAVCIKKEILLVILGGVFVVEAVSVIMQVASFKMTGKRIFKMAPFHHHLQLSGWKESKIITRFWIVAIILAIITLSTLKIR